MPRRRKIGGSPSRKTGAAAVVSQGDPRLSMSQVAYSVNKEELFNGMSEMFSDLDPSVVYMVLSECDFKVENAMDYLLELSTHAEGAASSKVSDFGSVASSLALVNQQRSVANQRVRESTEKHCNSEEEREKVLPPDVQLTEELDSLIEDAFQRCRLSDKLPNSANDQIVCEYDDFKEFPEWEESDLGRDALLFPQQMGTNNEVFKNFCCSQLPVNQLSVQTSSATSSNSSAQALGDSDSSQIHVHHDVASEAYKQSNGEMSCGNSDQAQHTVSDHESAATASCEPCQGALELGAAITEEPNSQCLQKYHGELMTAGYNHNASLPEACVSLEKSSFKTPKLKDLQQSEQSYSLNLSAPSCWTQQHGNLIAPAFYPSTGSHSFVTPVALSPGQWRPISEYRTLEKGLIFSSPVVPNAWDSSPSLKVWENQDRNSKLNLSQAQQPPVYHMMRKKMHLVGQVLVLLRGVPGSGKSYLARMMLEDNPGGVILSTDDYFYKRGQYHYDADCLGEAHEWNRKRAKEAFEMKISPIIIDNTNIQAWEMKPYVTLAQQFKYKVMFREPDTWWKFKPKELERRNIHGVSKEKIKRMLEQYERCLTVNSILDSSVPEKSQVAAWSEDPCQEERHREREAHCDKKENKPFASDLEPLNLTEDDKPLSGSSLTSESNCAPESYQKDEKEIENHSVEHSTENNAIQDDLDVDLSSCVEKELPLETKEEKGERMEEITETEMDDIDMITTEETVCFHRAGVEKHNNNVLKAQTETEQNGEIGTESDSTQRSNVVEPSSSALEASRKPELLNFLGDWPVQQTMGQRVKRTRRLEKSSLKSDQEGKATCQHPELVKEQADLPDTCTLVKGQEGESTTSSCFSVSSDKVAPDLQMVGHWPVSLEQRQQRSRRMRKTSLSQSDESRNAEGDNTSALDTVDVLRGTPVDPVEPQDMRELHFHQPEMVGAGTITEKKTLQSKRTRKHHKLALTFTNSNLPNSREEEQLSVPNSAEEKQYSCKQISSHSQTEAHDFALLWRLENKVLFPETVKVLHGRLDGFKPKDMDNASGSQEKIPYRVMYDKSTFVEENELIDIDEAEKLNMLCKLFDSFSVEAVKDLYERCNKDINWATGLLLDSVEKLHKDVNTECFQVKEVEPVVAGFDFKENTNNDEDLENCTHAEQIIGASDVSDPSEDKNSSISTAESRATKTTVTDADVSDSFTAVLLNDSVEQKNGSDTGPRDDAGSLAAGVVEQSIPGMQKMESVSPVEEVMNKLSVSQVDVGLYVPVTLSHALETNTNLKLSNESDGNSSESNAVNAEGMPLLLEMDDVPLIDSRSDKELETDKENLGSSTVIRGEEESGASSRNEDKAKIQSPSPVSSAAFDIDSLELMLPPELALQLKEIFGPVGIDAGSLTAEDCVVHIDLNLAKVIHEKWKESILKRQRRDESWKLSAEDSKMQKKGMNVVSSSSNEMQTEKAAGSEVFPFMDHWNARTQKVSLRQIISEEIAMQEKEDLKRVPSLARKDCAAKLKEKQLFEMFPTINQNFLMDIFKDNNYSLEQTEQFLNCVLEADPVKTVIAQESIQRNEIISSNSAARNREKARKAKEEDEVLSEIFQEYEYPQYDDFRAEAFHHQQKRRECLKKAGEAYHMGMKPVAAFYAHQGRLHEQKMKEANRAAAAQIFERVNTSLLPLNVLDLHGLHVDEAVNRLSRVLQEKSNEYQLSGGKPYLCVITGRGSHSQGGVARIKPAAIRYLTSHNFRFAEIKPGCLKVMLN